MKKFISILLFFIAVSCSLAPKYNPPEILLPEKYKNLSGAYISNNKWWRHFNSEVLNQFIDEALANNKDIAISLAKIEKAAALITSAKSNYYPKFNGSIQGSQSWIKGNEVTGNSMPFLAGLNVSWQIDLFGRYKNTTLSAKASFISNKYVYEGVVLSIISQTISTFYLLNSLDLQLKIAEKTIISREKTVKIYKERYEAGLISLFDYSQMKSSLEEAKKMYYNIKISRENTETALMILIGKSPKEIYEKNIENTENIENIFILPVIPEGLPSSLLERRPDIKSAEQNIIIANANIGVAKAMYFPNISLTGLFGIVSQQFENLFTNPLLGWNYVGALNVPLLNFGEISSKVKEVEALKKEAILNYEKTVQKAFADLRKSLINQTEKRKILKSLEIMKDELKTAYNIAIIQYEKGFISYIDLLETERNLFETEINLAQARSDYILSIVDVCVSLGGGFNQSEDEKE